MTSLKIIQVDKEMGTVEVEWNGSRRTTWNYNIPFDSNNVALRGTELFMHLISQVYHILKQAEDSAAQDIRSIEAMVGNTYDVSELKEEYAVITEEAEEASL